MKVATSIGLVLLASLALVGADPAARSASTKSELRAPAHPLRFDGVDPMQFGEGAACACILVVDTRGRGVPSATVAEVAKRRGGITDSLGRLVFCGLPNGRLRVKASAFNFEPQWDSVVIERNRPDTLIMKMRWRAGEKD